MPITENECHSDNINSIILQASSFMDNAKYNKALDLINNGINLDKNNYELIFMKALCLVQLGYIEDAYYLYKLAIFISDSSNSNDSAIINNEFEHMCSNSNADPYKLGKALEHLIIERIKLKEYTITFEFLKVFIYDTNKFSANINLTDGNMLLCMMLEIYASEQSHSAIVDEAGMTNLFFRDDVGISLFKEIYCNVKHAIRRIWFGINFKCQNYICELISRYQLSPDALLILIKYSVEETFLCDVLQKTSDIIKSNFPIYADFIQLHSKWLKDNNLNCTNICFSPQSYTNNAIITYLDYNNFKSESIKQYEYSKIINRELDYSKISIIFCTNNDTYSNECILYLKQLLVPENMTLDIIVVKQAPGMAAGYNYAMLHSNSGYKLYIHHDTFIIDYNLLHKLVKAFEFDTKIGMIGNTGSTHLTNTARWFESDIQYKRSNIYEDILLNIKRCNSLYTLSNLEYADAIDGIFMATSYDVLWRQDLFDGWHYYDISQTYEYRKVSLKTVFTTSPPVMLLHETTTVKDPLDLYDKYQKIFINNYF